MAITIAVRPRKIAYINDASPGAPVYSNWNAGWNPIVYEFAVPQSTDLLSSLLIEVFEVGSNTLLSSDTIRPFRSGNLKFDVSPNVRAYLFSKFDTDFTDGQNFADAGNAITFYITYTQQFDNGDPDIFNSDQSRPIVACCSAMQFGDVLNGNMEPYIPFTADRPEANKMKFLTAFETPVMWAGFPFTLSFIYSKYLIGVQVYKKETQQNINYADLTFANTDLDTNQTGKVNYLLVNEPNQPNARYMKVSLHTGEAISHYYVDPGYVDEGYHQIQ